MPTHAPVANGAPQAAAADRGTQIQHLSSDLDIVNTLSTLNIDDDIDRHLALRSSLAALAASDGASLSGSGSTTAPFGLHFLSPLASASSTSVPPALEKFTPTPPAVAAFGTVSGATPQSTWSRNFVPLSAPPFTSASHNSMEQQAVSEQLAGQIAPFALPGKSTSGADGAGKDFGGSFAALLPLFGAALDSRFLYSGNDLFDAANVQQDRKDLNLQRHSSGWAASGDHYVLNVWNAPQQLAYDLPQMNLDSFAALRLANGNLGAVSESHRGRSLSFGQNSQTHHRNQHHIQQNHHNDVNNHYHQHHQHQHQHQHHHQHHGQQNHLNSQNSFQGYSVNVHRKSHNAHRRKGEDAAKYANARIQDFVGDIMTLCKDQHGCRFLQRQLEVAKNEADLALLTVEEVASMIFTEIQDHVVDLMTDPFGNYLVQRLFENVSSEERLVLVKNAAPSLVRISLDPHGTRALQKLVECISTSDESALVIANLSPHIVALSRDLNGNHVVQKCLQKFGSETNQFIFDTASTHCKAIATHRHGCCVLQRCLDHGSASQRLQLSLKVAENAFDLSLDPFGNYVVQYVLSRGDEASVELILKHIRENVISLALHKFGSNVIEKSLRIPKLTDGVIQVLLQKQSKFAVLLNDAYGNYVLQTSLDVASRSDLAALAAALQPLLPNIKNTPHGRRIMTKIQNL